MFFHSYGFILLFLPAAVGGYFLCNRLGSRWGKVFLLGASLGFAGLFGWKSLAILCGSVLGNFLLAAGMRRIGGKRGRRALFLCGVCANLALLLVFKYTGFFVETLNALGGLGIAVPELLLPVGISFYTFQQLAFLTDSYRDPDLSYPLLDYSLYAVFFPYFISGPITLHSQMIPQFQDEGRKRFDPEHFAKGLCSFSLGLGKKALLADAFGPGADWAFSHVAELNAPEAWLAMLCYTLQIYFDFSGYSDMARGVGLMLNLELPINFDSPYRALSVTDFWKRWHMSLTSFFTRYVYIPLGGNRKGTARTYCNVMIVFLLSGFWHGAGWTFLLWGLLHGLGSVFCRVMAERRGKGRESRIPRALRWLITFLFINGTWVVFRAGSVRDALRLGKRLLLGGFGPVSSEFCSPFLLEPLASLTHILGLPETWAAFGLALLLLAFGLWASVFWKNTQERIESSPFGGKLAAACVVCLVWSLLSLSGVTSFIYVNF